MLSDKIAGNIGLILLFVLQKMICYYKFIILINCVLFLLKGNNFVLQER